MFPEAEQATRNGKAPCADCLDERSLFDELNNRLATIENTTRNIDRQTLVLMGVLLVVLWRVRRGVA